MTRIRLVCTLSAAILVAACASGEMPGEQIDAAAPGSPDAAPGSPDAAPQAGCPLTDPDDDGDGVCNSADVCAGFDDALDADNDGVADGCDVCAGSDDAVDADSDSVPDGCDVCAGGDDTVDADADSVPNDCDICPGFDDAVDPDNDGVPDGCDACQGFVDSVDNDNDGVPDGCDECAGFDDTIDVNNNGVPDGCDELLIDLTPSSGSLVSADDPYWASKGYLLTASQTINVVALEWWINLPSAATISARIYNSAGTLVASGTAVAGQNNEQWYRSDITYTLVAGQTYTVSMYHSAASTGTFDRRDDATQGFAVSPYVTNVNSRSNCGTPQSDERPTCTNSWFPYQRIVSTP